MTLRRIVDLLGTCPDCDSDHELVPEPDHPGITLLKIRHDDTCPTYRRLKSEGRAT